MKMVLQILGLAALLVGILWICQGMGLVRWPASSFMTDERAWVVRGTLLAVVGGILLWLSRQR